VFEDGSKMPMRTRFDIVFRKCWSEVDRMDAVDSWGLDDKLGVGFLMELEKTITPVRCLCCVPLV
jgi:hypothetical protein